MSFSPSLSLFLFLPSSPPPPAPLLHHSQFPLETIRVSPVAEQPLRHRGTKPHEGTPNRVGGTSRHVRGHMDRRPDVTVYPPPSLMARRSCSKRPPQAPCPLTRTDCHSGATEPGSPHSVPFFPHQKEVKLKARVVTGGGWRVGRGEGGG